MAEGGPYGGGGRILKETGIWSRIRDAALALAMALLATRALLFHSDIYRFPQQLEPTEGGLMMSTRAILAGWDPWAVTLAPVYSNNYGIGYPWVAALASHLAPSLGLLQVLRAVSAASIFFVLGLMYLTLKDGECGLLEAAAACLAAYIPLLYGDIPSGRPDTLAVALYLASLVLVLRPGIKTVAVAASLAALAYFVKPYAVLALGLGAWHLARTRRWRDLRVFLTVGVGVLVLTGLWVTLNHPYYFLGTVFVLSSNAGYNILWLWLQLWDLLHCHFPVLLVAAGAAMAAFKRQGPWRPQGPALDWGWLALGCLVVLVVGPGGHTGAYMRYFDELFVPLALLFLVLWAGQLRVGAWLLALALLGNALISWDYSRATSFPVSAADYAGWIKADQWVASHPQGIFPPLFTSLAVSHHAYVFDTDHSHYLSGARAFGLPSPMADFANQRRNWYLKQMAEGKLQTVVCGAYWHCPPGLTGMGYREVDPLCLRTPMTASLVCFSVFVPVKAVIRRHDGA
jgi:hypothetical protein